MNINTNTPPLRFGLGNAKLAKSIATFSLPAGYSCPFAKNCLSKADRTTGKIVDGKHCEFRCFAASQECTYPGVRKSRWFNFDTVKSFKDLPSLAVLIHRSLPRHIDKVRVHVSGDFFSETYFLAWLNVAINNPTIIFYGYTKAVKYLVKYKTQIPQNFRFTASKGGTCDSLIKKHNLKSAEVVYSLKEAKQKRLEIDHDDTLAIEGKSSFALLLHGVQPAKSKAGNAMRELRKQGIFGYSAKLGIRQIIPETVSVPITVIAKQPKFKLCKQNAKMN